VDNLVLARLREAVGDEAGAARVIGRVPIALPITPGYRQVDSARVRLAGLVGR
jgi:hypothetical protein